MLAGMLMLLENLYQYGICWVCVGHSTLNLWTFALIYSEYYYYYKYLVLNNVIWPTPSVFI